MPHFEIPQQSPLFNVKVFSDAPEPTFWQAEPSRAFWSASRAEPSFSIFKNEPKRALKFFQNLIDIFSMHCRKHSIT